MNYLKEAFSRLSLLEDEIPASEIDWKEKVAKYLEDDVPVEEEEEIIDPEAVSEADIQDSYVGKVIIECNSCHTRLYKDQDDLGANEDGSAVEIAEDCPVCGQHGTGWTVIGKIEPFDANQEFPEDGEPVEAGSDDDIDFGADEEPVEADAEAEVNDDIDLDGEEAEFEDEDEDEFDEAFKQAFEEENKPEDLEEAADENPDDVCPDCGKVSEECKCAAKHKAKFERSRMNDKEAERELVSNEKIKEGLTEGDHCCHGECDHEEVDEACVKENAMMDRLRAKMMKMGEACEEEVEESLKNSDVACEDDVKLDEEKCPECGDEIKSKDDMCDACKEKAEKKDESLEEELHIEASGEDKVDIVKNDDGSVSLEVGGGFDEDFVGDPADDIGGEMIAPIDQVQADEIAAQSLEDEEAPAEDVDANVEDDLGLDAAEEDAEVPAEEDELADLEGDEFDDFQEESFNYLGEAYLRKVYENVNSFKTTDVKLTDGGLVVEGLIKFESGKEKATEFVFENMQKTKRGKFVFEGLNNTFSNSNKAFTLKGNIVDKAFVCESMVYNYTTKTLNESNESESVKVCGKVVAK